MYASTRGEEIKSNKKNPFTLFCPSRTGARSKIKTLKRESEREGNGEREGEGRRGEGKSGYFMARWANGGN